MRRFALRLFNLSTEQHSDLPALKKIIAETNSFLVLATMREKNDDALIYDINKRTLILMGSEISHKIDQYVVRSQRNQQNILSVELKNASALLKQVTRSHDILEMIPHLTTAWNDHCQAKNTFTGCLYECIQELNNLRLDVIKVGVLEKINTADSSEIKAASSLADIIIALKKLEQTDAVSATSDAIKNLDALKKPKSLSPTTTQTTSPHK
ncbi:MAG: hypothetical protein NTU49_10150 [Gammaproteobacteria bacterium]|nr:hypothetical protein [Gammaproteobacteria bacterium]